MYCVSWFFLILVPHPLNHQQWQHKLRPSSYSWPLEHFLTIWSVVPRVRGGNCSGASHGKLRGYSSIHNKSLVSISSKYNIYAILLSDEWCLNLFIHLEGLMNSPSMLKCLVLSWFKWGISVFMKMAQLPYIAYFASNQLRSKNKHPLKSKFRWGQFYYLNWSDPF